MLTVRCDETACECECEGGKIRTHNEIVWNFRCNRCGAAVEISEGVARCISCQSKDLISHTEHAEAARRNYAALMRTTGQERKDALAGYDLIATTERNNWNTTTRGIGYSGPDFRLGELPKGFRK